MCCLTGALQGCIVGNPKTSWGAVDCSHSWDIWISVVFVIVPVTAVLALKPESYTFWDKVLTFYVRSKIGRAPAFFVLNVHGTVSCPKCAGGCHPQLFASTL